MKKLVGVISLVLASTNAFALSSNIEVVAKNTSFETNLCVIAAKQGYQAVTEAAGNSHNLASTKCNGMDIKKFAKYFKPETAKKVVVKEVVMGNKSKETQLCVKAVEEGVGAVGHKVNTLKCNGQSVKSFVKAVKNS